MKIDKKVLRRDAWHVPTASCGGRRRTAPLRALTDDDRERLAHLLGAPADGGPPATVRRAP